MSNDTEFLEVQGNALRKAAMERDYELTGKIMAHMRAEGLTAEQIAEASDGLPVNAQQRLRQTRGRVVRQTWVSWAKEQESPKPSWLIPWEELDESQREVDMRIGDAIAQAEQAARGLAERNVVYAACAVLFRCRHELPSDILRSLADIWICASAARFGAPFETWWWDDQDEVYRDHDTAECEAESGLYSEPWDGGDWDPEAGQ